MGDIVYKRVGTYGPKSPFIFTTFEQRSFHKFISTLPLLLSSNNIIL